MFDTQFTTPEQLPTTETNIHFMRGSNRRIVSQNNNHLPTAPTDLDKLHISIPINYITFHYDFGIFWRTAV